MPGRKKIAISSFFFGQMLADSKKGCTFATAIGKQTDASDKMTNWFLG